jgi:anti-anti-sigma factor
VVHDLEVRPAVRCPEVEIRVQGALDLASVARMRERLFDALSLKPHCLAVDLSECTFFDATGINLLLEVHRQAWRQESRLQLLGCTARHLRLLALMGLLDVFDTGDGSGPGRTRYGRRAAP